jgi:pimeloyl-ACP methyl ester carboxylesterase
VRLQEAGVYSAAFAAITSHVLMLHGTYDPHPGQMIRARFAPFLPQWEYREWERCGHHPWGEQFVRDEFSAVLREWLARQLTEWRGAASAGYVIRLSGGVGGTRS